MGLVKALASEDAAYRGDTKRRAQTVDFGDSNVHRHLEYGTCGKCDTARSR